MPLESLIEKASALALADVPAFGRRKTPSLDRLFSELIDEQKTDIRKHVRKSSTSSVPYNIVNLDQECLMALPQSLVSDYGSKRYFIYFIIADMCNRIQNLFGEAIIHFETVEAKTNDPPIAQVDIFDELLGLTPKPRPATTTTASSSQDVKVRLEYDDATIDADAAAAYLARFQHYLETPSQLML
jgi:hypothetical protein